VLFRSVAAAGGSSALAQDKLQEVLDRGTLIVGTGSTNPPWHFRNDEGELVGFDTDIARIIANGLFDDPNAVEFVTQAPDARIPNLATDKVDISCQFMTVTAGRAQQVAFTVPYYREGVGLLLREDGDYADYEALREAGGDVTVSVLQNVYAEEMVHSALPEAQVDQYESPNLMYQALNSGRSDAAATDASSLAYYMAQNPGAYRDAGYFWNPQSYACAMKPGEPTWHRFVDTVLREAMMGVEFPAYADAFEQWFGVRPPAPEIGFPQEFR